MSMDNILSIHTICAYQEDDSGRSLFHANLLKKYGRLTLIISLHTSLLTFLSRLM